MFNPTLTLLIPKLIRYAKKIEFRVNALNTREFPEKAGRIYPPLVMVEYDEFDLVDTPKESFDFTFKVSYDMEVGETEKDIEISVGVLSAFAGTFLSSTFLPKVYFSRKKN